MVYLLDNISLDSGTQRRLPYLKRHDQNPEAAYPAVHGESVGVVCHVLEAPQSL